MRPQRIWLAITADLAMVRLAALSLQAILTELGCEPGHAQAIELCAVEAMNNVVEHAYAEDPGGRLELQVTPDGDRLELVLRDTGRPLPPGALDRARAGAAGEPGAPDEPELREGGYGLGLIVALMSEVHYVRVDETNALTMTTSLRRSPA